MICPENCRRAVADGIRLLLIILFFYAALSKWLDFDRFQHTLSVAPVIGPYSTVVSWLVPSVEVVLVILLAITPGQRVGLYGAFLLMITFTTYLAAMQVSGTTLPCSCGGILEGLSWFWHTVFNTAIILLTGAALYLTVSRPVQHSKTLLQ